MAKTRPYLPTLNEIRSAQPGHLKGYAVAEAFDQISKFLNDLGAQVTSIANSSGTITQTAATTTEVATTATAAARINSTSAATNVSFSTLTYGTNVTAVMVVGSGASLSYTDAGVVNASEIAGVAVTGTPAPGYALVATSPSTAAWTQLGILGLDCNDGSIPMLFWPGVITGIDCNNSGVSMALDCNG